MKRQASERRDDPAEQILAWYDRERRALPWREDPTPYHVWISEIMLQQTRVETVKEYYTRFLAAFPDIPALAAATEEQYLKCWEGLGYYSRVRNLHRAAVQLMAPPYGGELPGTSQELMQLPGIGRYTAAAIASICYGERVPAIDGNLLRVFARMTRFAGELPSALGSQAARRWYDERISPERPGDFNQAMMDLGATVCLPRTLPHCGDCPWAASCAAHRSGEEQDYPRRTAKPEQPREQRTVFLVESPEAGTIYLHRRPERGLLAGLWEFPNVTGRLSAEEARRWADAQGFGVLALEALPAARHVFTHRIWEMTGYRLTVAGREDEALPASATEEQESEFIIHSGTQAADPGSAPGRMTLHAVDVRALAEHYPIPSAFAAYRALLTLSPPSAR